MPMLVYGRAGVAKFFRQEKYLWPIPLGTQLLALRGELNSGTMFFEQLARKTGELVPRPRFRKKARVEGYSPPISIETKISPMFNRSDFCFYGVIISFARTYFQKQTDEWTPCRRSLCSPPSKKILPQFFQNGGAQNLIKWRVFSCLALPLASQAAGLIR